MYQEALRIELLEVSTGPYARRAHIPSNDRGVPLAIDAYDLDRPESKLSALSMNAEESCAGLNLLKLDRHHFTSIVRPHFGQRLPASPSHGLSRYAKHRGREGSAGAIDGSDVSFVIVPS
jgi:hypothetical protein